MAHLELEALTKRYPGVTSVDRIDLAVEPGEFICLLGPSGCGKTTTLRMIAGFIEPDEGRIRVEGKVISAPGSVVPPERRNMGMIFQSYAIWPHMTVRENVAYGLRMRGVGADETRKRVDTMLAAAKLSELGERYPAELSGGQQQRVALARALAPRPSILLLDEPLSNLDANLRGDMRLEIRRLHDEFRDTSIYVTHDQLEAMTMADRIVVMNAGRIEQVGTPRELYDRPNSRFVARFIGASNVLDARHVGGNEVSVGGQSLRVGEGDFADEMGLCVKMHDIEILGEGVPHAGNNVLPGVVRSHAYLGSHRDYVIDVGQDVLVAAPPSLEVAPGSKVKLRFPAEKCRGLAR
jgi:iron(III) transport system ATP-binding protein